MIVVARMFVRTSRRSITEPEIRRVGSEAQHAADQSAGQLEALGGLGLRLRVEEGSLIVVAELLATFAAFSAALLVADLALEKAEDLRQRALRVGSDFITKLEDSPVISSDAIVRTRVTAGALDKLHRVHEQVRLGELTPDLGADQVVKYLARTDGVELTVDAIEKIESVFGAPSRGISRLYSRDESSAPSRGIDRGDRSAFEAIEVSKYRIEKALPRKSSGERPRRRLRLAIYRSPGAVQADVRLDVIE